MIKNTSLALVFFYVDKLRVIKREEHDNAREQNAG
jgi:hypothetical protein|tara:strand:- start:1651 stop:1755 length:105 start_codon:yes stop_codon:yes gene_type:complete